MTTLIWRRLPSSPPATSVLHSQLCKSKQPAAGVAALGLLCTMTKRHREHQRAPNSPNLDAFLSWTDSYKKVSKWFARYDLEEQLDQNDGLVELTDFLPTNIAEGALRVLQQVPEVCACHQKECHLAPAFFGQVLRA